MNDNNSNTNARSESVLKALRDLVPRRALSYAESLRIAELQANHLLEQFAVPGPLVPSELVSHLPRIQVVHDSDLPVSGSAYWQSGQWVITLKPTEAITRRRFSLVHEFKHVLDHTTRQFLYGEGDVANLRAERAADYFAAYLLMPKRWVKQLWGSGIQSVEELAARFAVSPQAMEVRLRLIGLTEPSERCAPRPLTTRRRASAALDPTRPRTSQRTEGIPGYARAA